MFEDYTILNGSDTRLASAQSDLVKRVRDQMAQGWQPQGGATYVGTMNDHGYICYVFSQAMVKSAVGISPMIDDNP